MWKLAVGVPESRARGGDSLASLPFKFRAPVWSRLLPHASLCLPPILASKPLLAFSEGGGPQCENRKQPFKLKPTLYSASAPGIHPGFSSSQREIEVDLPLSATLTLF